MARKDRTGNRKNREQQRKFKKPELGYYLIVTDTEGTERCFFEGMHADLPDKIKDKIVIKVVETKTRKMIDKCIEMTSYEAQYRIPWIIFDRDQVKEFEEIIIEAESKGIKVGWSNPCFEIWLYAYFGAMPAIHESWMCCSEFSRIYEKKTGQKYSKVDEQLYSRICKIGDENKAIGIAKQKLEQCVREGKVKPSDMCPGTMVYQLVEEISGNK
ncbi:MAG: RloB family protein [Eubacteriales bacterium]